MKKTISMVQFFPTAADIRQLGAINKLGGLMAAIPSGKIDLSESMPTLNVNVFTVGTPLSGTAAVNMWIVADPSTGNWILFDAGSELNADLVANQITSEFDLDFSKFQCVYLTHLDPDHVSALVQPKFGGVPVYYNADDLALAEGGPRSTCCGIALSRGPALSPTINLRPLHLSGTESKDVLAEHLSSLLCPLGCKFPVDSLMMTACPGHTPGSSYLTVTKGNNTLIFAGDALRFKKMGLLGMTDMNHGQCIASVSAQLRTDIENALGAGRKVAVFTGHTGYSTDGQAILDAIEKEAHSCVIL